MDRFEKFSALSLILLIISTSLVFFQASAIPSPSRPSNVEPGSMTKPCNYIVFKDGSKILANNCSTGVNDYSETDIAITLQDIFTNKCANGCTVKVQNDLYTTSSTVNILTDNVWLDFGWAQITYNGA